MLRPHTTLVFLTAAIAAFALIASAPTTSAGPEQQPEAISRLSTALEAGPAMRAGALMVVPIRQSEKATALPIRIGFEHAHDLTLTDAADRGAPHALRIANRGDRGIFLPAGALIAGGSRDRMLTRDVLVAPQAAVVVDALPAAYERRASQEPGPYRLAPMMAPGYLREMAAFDPSRYEVRKLLRHFAALLPPEEEQPLSLVTLLTSERLKAYCVACDADVQAFDALVTPTTVGFATFIHGRLQAFELYGSNTLLQAHFEPTLRAHAFKAAALTQHARTMGIPLHDDGADADAPARARRVVSDVIRDLDGATLRDRIEPVDGTMGATWELRTHRARGTMLRHGDRTIHLALFVHDPYEDALFGRELDEPTADRKSEQADGFTGRKARERRERRRELLPDDAAKDLERARKGDAIRKSLRPLRRIR